MAKTKATLIDIFERLTQTYAELATTSEDPRVLKEIREFLKDNDITKETLDMMRGMDQGLDDIVDFDLELAQ